MLEIIAAILLIVVPNANSQSGQGVIGPNDVIVHAYYENLEETFAANSLGIIDTTNGIIDYHQVGCANYVSRSLCRSPELFLATPGDLINESTLNSFAYFVKYLEEPTIVGGAVYIPPVGEKYYVGLVTRNVTNYPLTYAWFEMISLGDGNFAEGYSAVAYNGETLRVGNTYGDYNCDGEIDGRDFMLWQRDTSLGPISDFQDSYGVSPLMIRAIPEPSSVLLLLLGPLYFYNIRVSYP